MNIQFSGRVPKYGSLNDCRDWQDEYMEAMIEWEHGENSLTTDM